LASVFAWTAPVLALCWGAQARAQSDGAVEGEMIVWSTSRSQSAAEEQLRLFGVFRTPLAPVIEVSGPTVLESSKVRGLRPGAYVVALGICSKEEVRFPLRIFQALYPDVTAHTVKYKPTGNGDDLPCPTPRSAGNDDSGGPVPWRLATPGRAPMRDLALVELPFSAGPEGRSADLRVSLLLVDARKRALIDATEYRPPSERAQVRPAAVNPRGLSFQVAYEDPGCESGEGRFVRWGANVTVTVAGRSVQTSREVTRLKEGRCGGGGESRIADAPASVPAKVEAAHESKIEALPDLPLR
jgi:hypothetical protein